MTPEELAAIRERYEALEIINYRGDIGAQITYFLRDHAVLVAEVQRLRSVLEQITHPRMLRREVWALAKSALGQEPVMEQATSTDIAAWDEGMR